MLEAELTKSMLTYEDKQGRHFIPLAAVERILVSDKGTYIDTNVTTYCVESRLGLASLIDMKSYTNRRFEDDGK